MTLHGLLQLPDSQLPQLCPILCLSLTASVFLIQPYRLCNLPMVLAHLSGLSNSSCTLTELILE